jgi:type IX secretion system PorP/SprF family membrane protein
MIIMSLSLCGQSDIDLNHHWLWRLDHNPATIKNNDFFEVNLLGRFQWMGFDGAPQTYMASGSRFFNNINSGFAAVIISDRIGFTQKNVYKGIYSYSFTSNSETSIFSMGLSFGVNQNSLAHDKITVADDVINPDIVTYYVEDNKIKPDFDFGATYTLRPKGANYLKAVEPLLQIGASVTHIDQILNRANKTSCNYYAYVIGNIPVGRIRVNPGLSLVHRGNITSAELNAMINTNRFWAGGSLKFRGNEIALLGGIHISNYIGLGYSLDLTYSSVGNKSRTSHEIFLIIRFPSEQDTTCDAYRQSVSKRKYNKMFNNFLM